MENDIDKVLEDIQHNINILEGRKAAIIKGYAIDNEALLFGEVLDLLTRTNITVGDYYAPDRKYSDIEGIKNLRIASKNDEMTLIDIKVDSKSGEYFAKFWEAQSPVVIADYKVSFCCSYSKRYYE